MNIRMTIVFIILCLSSLTILDAKNTQLNLTEKE
jgi:hypothetical protein